MDLWQAGYSNIHIMKALALKDVPDKQFIFQALNRCELCFRTSHPGSVCPNKSCASCLNLGYICSIHNVSVKSSTQCYKCFSHLHDSSACTIGLRCHICMQLGHRGWQCISKWKDQTCAVWKKKKKWIINREEGGRWSGA